MKQYYCGPELTLLPFSSEEILPLLQIMVAESIPIKDIIIQIVHKFIEDGTRQEYIFHYLSSVIESSNAETISDVLVSIQATS